MSDNLKAPARKVQEVCRNTRVKKALQKLVASNTSADRGEQWGQVSKQFSTNCDTAQRIILTPTPTEQLLKQMDPEYTKSIADRVLANANNSSNELNKLKKERANLVAGRNSIDEDPSSPSFTPIASNSNNQNGGKRRRRNKTKMNRKNRNRKTRRSTRR